MRQWWLGKGSGLSQGDTVSQSATARWQAGSLFRAIVIHFFVPQQLALASFYYAGRQPHAGERVNLTGRRMKTAGRMSRV
jgi:hypothetical protein